MTRVLRPNLLAPDILESILAGTLRSKMSLTLVMKPSPVGWEGQPEQLY